jgi:hypothetical protein
VIFIGLAWMLSRWLGLAGIPLAAALTFTTQALVLLCLQNRKYPGLLNLGGSLPRAILAAVLGGGAAVGGMTLLPFSGTISAVIALAIGLIVVLPLIWKEIRLLLHL